MKLFLTTLRLNKALACLFNFYSSYNRNINDNMGILIKCYGLTSIYGVDFWTFPILKIYEVQKFTPLMKL